MKLGRLDVQPPISTYSQPSITKINLHPSLPPITSTYSARTSSPTTPALSPTSEMSSLNSTETMPSGTTSRNYWDYTRSLAVDCACPPLAISYPFEGDLYALKSPADHPDERDYHYFPQHPARNYEDLEDRRLLRKVLLAVYETQKWQAK